MHRLSTILLILPVVLGLAACQTRGPTPYQAATTTTAAGKGYSERWVSEDTYEVTFSGNTQTDRETVETYALYRAAELAREHGYQSFALLDRETEEQVVRNYYYDPVYSPFYYSRYGYRPHRYGYQAYPWGDRPYAYRPYGYRPYGWRPYGYRSYGPAYVRRSYETQEFRATAKVQLYNGEPPEGALKTFEVARVLQELGPRVRRPAPTGNY